MVMVVIVVVMAMLLITTNVFSAAHTLLSTWGHSKHCANHQSSSYDAGFLLLSLLQTRKHGTEIILPKATHLKCDDADSVSVLSPGQESFLVH